MKIVVAGGSGLIGQALCARLAGSGHETTVLSRAPERAASRPGGARILGWRGAARAWEDAVAEADGVVNLAGASIPAHRWTEAYKEEIRQSRLGPTAALVGALGRARRAGRVLVSGSAVGYYGDTQDAEVTEKTPPADDFLARLAREWEAEAQKAEAIGVRVVLVRTGIVLAQGGGALPKLAAPFRFFLGGRLGNGRQWMPWIHLEDEAGLIGFALETEAARGPMNATAPRPVTMREFARALGRVLGRPSFFKVPAFALKLAVGELAEALLGGQRALPEAALAWGYHFRYPDLDGALAMLYGPRAGAAA